MGRKTKENISWLYGEREYYYDYSGRWMMILEKGDMWSVFGKTDLFCFTANSNVKSNERLVMGRGMAEQVRDRLADIDYLLGKTILNKMNYQNCSYYGLATVEHTGQLVTAFQVKYHHLNDASIELIARSSLELFYYIYTDFVTLRHEPRIDINFPGIGNGRLHRDKVFDVIRFLPDVVHVWEY